MGHLFAVSGEHIIISKLKMKQKTKTTSISVRPFPGERLTFLARADLSAGRERGALEDLNMAQEDGKQGAHSLSFPTGALVVGTVSTPSFWMRTQWLSQVK